MKKQRSTKYAYWKWVILNNLCNFNKDSILIHNNQDDNILIYDIDNKKIKNINYNHEFEAFFKLGLLGTLITIGELEEFYKGLPSKYKNIFWDSIG